jgi:hypothetical protein
MGFKFSLFQRKMFSYFLVFGVTENDVQTKNDQKSFFNFCKIVFIF